MYTTDRKVLRKRGWCCATAVGPEQSTRKIVVGSGWYSNEKSTIVKDRRWGGFASRSPAFATNWLQRVLGQSLCPIKVSILDACSPNPLPAEVADHDKVDVTRQIKNFGHAQQVARHNIECGWARGFLHGAMVAHVNSCDYVYVEQDCVLFGKDVFLSMFETLRRQDKGMCYMRDLKRHADKSGDRQPLQQCLVAVTRETLPFVISELATQTNHRIPEEHKHYNLFKDVIAWAPFSGGRDTPSAGQKNYCRQHMTDEEMKEVLG